MVEGVQRRQHALRCYFENRATITGASALHGSPIEIAVGALNQPVRAGAVVEVETGQGGKRALGRHLENSSATVEGAALARATASCGAVEIPVRGLHQTRGPPAFRSRARKAVQSGQHALRRDPKDGAATSVAGGSGASLIGRPVEVPVYPLDEADQRVREKTGTAPRRKAIEGGQYPRGSDPEHSAAVVATAAPFGCPI